MSDRDAKNTVQAKHHQLIPVDALQRAIDEGRDIGFNDVVAFVCKNIDPYAAPALAHALKYQTRMGRKDDERKEVEKAIWYLMDLHNRFSDLKEEPRDFAPWFNLGKISQRLQAREEWDKEECEKDFDDTFPEPVEVEEPVEENKFEGEWVKEPNAFIGQEDYTERLNKDVIKVGDTIRFDKANAGILKGVPGTVGIFGDTGDLCFDGVAYFSHEQEISVFRKVTWEDVKDPIRPDYYMSESVFKAGDIIRFPEYSDTRIESGEEYIVQETNGYAPVCIRPDGNTYYYFFQNTDVKVQKKVIHDS